MLHVCLSPLPLSLHALLAAAMSIFREQGLPGCQGLEQHFGWYCMSQGGGGGLTLSMVPGANRCDVVSSLPPFSLLVLCGKESFATGRTERRGANPLIAGLSS